jgi:hypothetical protein
MPNNHQSSSNPTSYSQPPCPASKVALPSTRAAQLPCTAMKCRFSPPVCAMRDADRFCLPMTVYRNESSYGWAYTNPLAPFLKKAEVFVTILPARFFQ